MTTFLTTTLTNGHLGGPPPRPLTCAGCAENPEERHQLLKKKCLALAAEVVGERTKVKDNPAKLASCKKIFAQELSVAAYALDWAHRTPRHAPEMLVLAANMLEIAEAKLEDLKNSKEPLPAIESEADRDYPVYSAPVLSENHIG